MEKSRACLQGTQVVANAVEAFLSSTRGWRLKCKTTENYGVQDIREKRQLVGHCRHEENTTVEMIRMDDSKSILGQGKSGPGQHRALGCGYRMAAGGD